MRRALGVLEKEGQHQHNGTLRHFVCCVTRQDLGGSPKGEGHTTTRGDTSSSDGDNGEARARYTVVCTLTGAGAVQHSVTVSRTHLQVPLVFV